MNKEKQRELLKDIIQADEKDNFYDWDVTLNDGLNEEEKEVTKQSFVQSDWYRELFKFRFNTK